MMKLSILFTSASICMLISACSESENPPVASFTTDADTYFTGDTIYFQSSCENATSLDWDFDDGTGSSEENPTHVYTEEGEYRVELTASNEDGSDIARKTLTIEPFYPCWTRLDDPPEGRNTPEEVLVNDRIYIMGGLGVSEVEEYDPSTDTWTKKADIPTPRQSLTACAINGKIYAIGGVSGSVVDEYHANVEVYDPVSDTWTIKTPMPEARTNHASVALDGKIYVIGGNRDWPVTELCNTIEIYDPESDTWTTRMAGDDFIPRWGLSACAMNGKIYVIGGTNATDAPVNALATVQEYDPVANTWTDKYHMATARFFASITSVNNRIYMIGGSGTMETHLDENDLQSVEAYDPLTDTWETKTPLPIATQGLAACELDQLIYVSGSYLYEYSYLYVYDPACDTNK